MKSQPMYRNQAPGDIVLCRRDSKGGDANIIGQRVLRPMVQTDHTHVALHMNGFLIHSTTQSGVDVVPAAEFFLRSGYHDNWRVFRHRSADVLLSDDLIKWVQSISDAADFYLGQKYNFAVGVSKQALFWRRKKLDESSFCSELIAKVYARLNLETGIRRRSPATVLPADVARATTSSENWIEVTDMYREYYEFIREQGEDTINTCVQVDKIAADNYKLSNELITLISEEIVHSHTFFSALEHGLNVFRQLLKLSPKTGPATDDSHIKSLESFNWRVKRKATDARSRLRRLVRARNRSRT